MWADSRHPSCFVSLLWNRLLYKKLVVCFTQEQEAAALLQKAQLKVLQSSVQGRLLLSRELGKPVPRQVPGAPELCSQVSQVSGESYLLGRWLPGRGCEFKRKLRVVRERCCNHWKCNYFKVLGHELVEVAG